MTDTTSILLSPQPRRAVNVILNSQIVQVPVGELKPHPRNPRKGNVSLIADSIRANGFYGAVVAQQSTGYILAGNHRWRAAAEAGMPDVPVLWVDVDDERALRILLADNRTSDVASNDPTVLTELLKALPDLTGTGYQPDDLKALLADVTMPDPVQDELPPVPVEPVTVLGDLWQVGPHRIICGDSSDPAVLDRLLAGVKVGCVLTDPPYGINLDTDYSGTSGGMKGRKYRPVANDDKPFDAGFLYAYFGEVAEQFWFGADYYRRTIPDDERAGCWLVWDKRDEDPDDDTSNWDDALGSTFELCWSRQRHKRLMLRYRWTNWTSHSNEGHKREHPTEKPAKMLAEILDRWAPKGCVVADPFAGSGAHLLAAAKTGRIGCGVELDAAYVDVIVARLERETGEKAVRVDA